MMSAIGIQVQARWLHFKLKGMFSGQHLLQGKHQFVFWHLQDFTSYLYYSDIVFPYFERNLDREHCNWWGQSLFMVAMNSDYAKESANFMGAYPDKKGGLRPSEEDRRKYRS